MSAMASQITSISIVCSIVGSGLDQRKHQSSPSLAFVWGIHWWPLNSPHKRPVTRKMLPFDVWDTSHNLIFRWVTPKPSPIHTISHSHNAVMLETHVVVFLSWFHDRELCVNISSKAQGVDSILRWDLTHIYNPILEIRWTYYCLISTMVFLILVRWLSLKIKKHFLYRQDDICE